MSIHLTKSEKEKKRGTNNCTVALAIVKHEKQSLICTKINDPDFICAYGMGMARNSIAVDEERRAVNLFLF